MERNKSVRSEPVSRKVEPFKFNRKDYHHKEEVPKQEEAEKIKIASIPPSEK